MVSRFADTELLRETFLYNTHTAKSLKSTGQLAMSLGLKALLAGLHRTEQLPVSAIEKHLLTSVKVEVPSIDQQDINATVSQDSILPAAISLTDINNFNW